MNLLTKLLRWLLMLVGGALTLLLAYAVWRVVKAYWAPLMLFAFVIVGIVFTVFSAVVSFRSRWTPGRDALYLMAGELAPQTKLERLRLAAEKPLGLLELLTGAWTYAVLHAVWHLLFRRRASAETLVQNAVRSNLEGVEKRVASTALFLVIVAYGAAYLAPAEIRWASAFLILIGINTLFRQLHYAVAFTSLPARLRRSTGNPYFSFLIVVVTDLLSLLLVLNGILTWGVGEVATWAGISGILMRFYFGDPWTLVKEVWNGSEPPFADVLVTGASGLYNVALLKNILHFGDFKRTDEDYAQVAQKYCIIGRYTDALKSLEQIKESTITACSLRAAAYIGVSQLDKAWEECKRILSFEGIEATPERILNVFFDRATTLSLTPSEYLAVLQRGIAVGSDVQMLSALNGLIGFGLASEAARPLFNDPARANRFPLSYARLLIEENNIDEAQTFLSQAKPKSVPEIIYHNYLVLLLSVKKPTNTREKRLVFDDWSGQNYDEISHCVADLSERVDGMELILVYTPILLIRLIAAAYHSHSEQGWVYLLDQLKKTIAGDKFAQKSLPLLDRLEGFGRRQLPA